MRNRTLLVALALLLLGFSKAHAADPTCDMRGLGGDVSRYNNLACSGFDAYEAGDYEMAMNQMEAALAVHLFEVPNFELLPWLASAYARYGDVAGAAETLDEAKGAMAVMHGEVVCIETDKGFHLASRDLGYVATMSEDLQQKIVLRMCGGVYEPLYAEDQEVINDALLGFYGMMEIADQEIQGMKNNRR